ncbi:lysoplasmalogenase [Sungkyunkwania multivorans]|uniref:Lysoplasmalogenase n=1 Tax=Sungkyunkwania multivorans TaxID=1173618 RepID=A0ABW3CWQ5_9FLAO
MKNLWPFIILFLGIVAIDLACLNIDGLYSVRYFTKPAVIISLGIFFFLNGKHLDRTQQIFMLVALACYAIGDIIFLNYQNDLNFMIGFIFFLIANVLYVLVFQFKVEYNIPRLFILSIIVLAYCFFLLRLLIPFLGDFFIPIIIFMVVMFSSLQSAYFRIKQVQANSFYLVLFGTMLYVITQSMVAYSRFVGPLPYEDYLTMLFYGLSHLAIVIGILLEDRNKTAH